MDFVNQSDRPLALHLGRLAWRAGGFRGLGLTGFIRFLGLIRFSGFRGFIGFRVYRVDTVYRV